MSVGVIPMSSISTTSLQVHGTKLAVNTLVLCTRAGT